jgi:hypothetical protein
MSQTLGYLFVFSDPQGTEISDQEFHDWYDNEHLPPRLSTPGFYSGVRYKATDAQTPRFAAYYEYQTGTLESAAYKKLFDERSQREANIFDKIYLSRRIYKLLSTHGKAAVNKPAKVIVYAGVTPRAGGEEEFNRWYVEDHMPLVQKNPGWIGARRFERAAEGDGTKYLIVHEYESLDFQTSPEFRACMEQAIEWFGKKIDSSVVRERRVFQRMYD